MPWNDEKHKLIYNELVNILGAEYVEDDPAIMQAFITRIPVGMQASASGVVGQAEQLVEFIVLPASTKDIQNIVKLANRYKFPYSISGTGLLINTVCAVKPYWVYIDPKRMDGIEIDEKNMYAIVQPYTTISRLQAETFKRGLFHGVPGSSSNSSVLAGSIFHQMHWTCWRTGVGRNLLGVEWVLPNGDVLRTGSLATPNGGYSWGEGPGPDLRGLLRGWEGHLGSLGCVTKVAVKLNPWPGPKEFKTQGVQPEKTSKLPEDLFKYYVLNFPTMQECLDAMREIGRCEIATVCMQFAPWDWVAWATKSKEEFWQKWESPYWKSMRMTGHMLWVGLWGYASAKQTLYEDKVLRSIVDDFNGDFAPDEEINWLNDYLMMDSVRDTHRLRFLRVLPLAFDLSMDSIEDTKILFPKLWNYRDQHAPPLPDKGFPTHKFWAPDFGRTAYAEMGVIGENSDECRDLMLSITQEITEEGLREQRPGMYNHRQVDMAGPAFSNVHILLGKIKKSMDPNNLANPTRTINLDVMEPILKKETKERG